MDGVDEIREWKEEGQAARREVETGERRKGKKEEIRVRGGRREGREERVGGSRAEKGGKRLDGET